MKNYFYLFNLKPKYAISQKCLHSHFKKLQKQFHPDKHVMQPSDFIKEMHAASADINQGFSILKNDASRAAYLCTMFGKYTEEELDKLILSPAFLEQQMNWREQLHELSQAERQTIIETEVQKEIKRLVQDLTYVIDEHSLPEESGKVDWSVAAIITKKILFLQNTTRYV